MSARDRQVGGGHYNGRIQPWDIIDRFLLGYYEGNILKYVARHQKKNGIEDLRKAAHYAQKQIEIEEARCIIARFVRCLFSCRTVQHHDARSWFLLPELETAIIHTLVRRRFYRVDQLIHIQTLIDRTIAREMAAQISCPQIS